MKNILLATIIILGTSYYYDTYATNPVLKQVTREYAQGNIKDTTSIDSDSIKANDNDSVKEKNNELSLMPFISYNRTLGGMFGLLPMYMYHYNKEDTISPKSLLGAHAVWTTNHSYFTGLFNRSYFGQGMWRASGALMYGKRNGTTSFSYADGSPGYFNADYSNEMFLIYAGIQYQIVSKLFVGIGSSYSTNYTDYSSEAEDYGGLVDDDVNSTTLIFVANYDTRNNQYYPTKGINTRARWITYQEWMGNDYQADRLLLEYNTYIPLNNSRDVLAARAAGKFGLGDIQFQQQQTIGGKDIRGYSSGDFRGDGMMDLQAEYRYNPFNKVGFVGFAGVATLYGSNVSDNDWKLYPGAGVGVRYRAFDTTKFNIGVDVAGGKDDWGVYFRIGEAF